SYLRSCGRRESASAIPTSSAPIRYTFGCCACAMCGRAMAAPNPAIDSRRFIPFALRTSCCLPTGPYDPSPALRLSRKEAFSERSWPALNGGSTSPLERGSRLEGQSPNHLVRPLQQQLGDRDPECLGGF